MYLPRISHFLVLVTLPLSRALTGDYVCHRMENYVVTSKEIYTEPVEKYTVEWCLSLPFRCPRTKTEMKQQYRIKSEIKTRSVDECCEGYIVQEVYGNVDNEGKCVPLCEKCVEGVCISPNKCLCNSGYQGEDCSYECPAGSWGKYCMQQCNCSSESICSPIDGSCKCSSGWQGIRCDEKCPSGWWGEKCESSCLCQSPVTECHHKTGECSDLGKATSGRNWTTGELFQASSESVVDLSVHLSTSQNNADFESSSFRNIKDFLTTQTFDQQLRRSEGTTERIVNNFASSSKVSLGDMSHETSTTKVHEDETMRNSEKKIINLDIDDESPNTKRMDDTILPRVILSPESDFVKNVRRDDATSPVPIPVDVAVLIVIGSMISLSLTSVAALMIFHMRSRLIKAIRMSIYNGEKRENNNLENSCPPKEIIPNIGTLSRASARMNSVFLVNPEPKAILTLDDMSNEYANGTVTIDIRNLRELLEGHYDRPTSSYQRCDNDEHTEHVYDEIPLSTSFCVSKNT